MTGESSGYNSEDAFEQEPEDPMDTFLSILISFDPYDRDLWIPCHDDAKKQRNDGGWKVQCEGIR